MKTPLNIKHLLPIFIIFILSFNVKAQLSTVTTSPPLAPNNGQSGVTFNLTATGSDIIIQEIDVTLNSGSQTGSVWYSTAPIAGPPVIAAPVWTQLTGFTGVGNNTTPVPFATNLGIVIPAGSTYGFCIAAGLRYEGTGTGFTGPGSYTDGTLTITTGSNVGYGGAPPSPNFHVRQFLGAVRYELAVTAQNNAGLVALNNPSGPVCGNNGAVNVDFRNSGTVPLTDLQLVWQVVRPGLPIPFPPVFTNWSGNLAPGGTVSNYSLGNLQGGFQPGDVLTVYTEFPNNVLDSANRDDTLRITMLNGFGGGFFTIGDTNTGNYDFHDMISAMAFVNGLEGICDSVVFTFMDTAVYAGPKHLFKPIGGASLNRPIMFRTSSGNPSQVTITHSSSDADSSFTIGFREANGVIFKGVTIAASSSTNGTAVKIFKSSRDIWFDNCVFTNNITNSTNTDASLFVINEGVSRNVFIEGSTFINGSYGLLSEAGEATNPNANWRIRNNVFQNQQIRFADLSLINGLNFSGNRTTSNSNQIGNNSIGFYFKRLVGNTEIVGNKMSSIGLFPQTSILLEECQSTQASPILVANNAIGTGKAFSNVQFIGFDYVSSSNIDFVYNTFYNEGLAPQGTCLRAESGGGLHLKNNIFSNFGSGLTVDFTTPTTVASSNYNNFYSQGSNILRYGTSNIASLPIYQSLIGFDSQSINVDPIFQNAPSNLRVCNAALDSAALPVSRVLFDVDGDARHHEFPDIGASEFTALDNFNLGGPFAICLGDSVQLFGSSSTGDNMLWSTGSTANSIWVSTGGNVTARVSNACGTTIKNTNVSVSKPVELSADSLHICADESNQIIANIGEPAQVLWNTGSTDSVIVVSTAGLYEVIVTNQFGCVSEASTFVTQSGKAAIFSDLNDDVICLGRSGFIDAGYSGGTYQWTGGVVSPTQQVTAINAGGLYSVEITDRGCISRDTIEIGEVSDPLASFIVGSSHFTISLTNTSSPATGLSYLWDFGDGNTSTQANPIHVYQNGNVYNVVLTVSNECGVSTANYSYAATLPGYGELIQANALEIYPNPSNGLLNIKSNDLSFVPERISITSIEGKLAMLFENFNGTLNQIDISNLPKGIYMLHVETPQGRASYKIVLQ